MQYEYQVVPFQAQKGSKQSAAQAAASQFAELITQMTAQGFEYYRMDHYTTMEPPGCLGAFLGQKAVFHSHDVAIFRRARS